MSLVRGIVAGVGIIVRNALGPAQRSDRPLSDRLTLDSVLLP